MDWWESYYVFDEPRNQSSTVFLFFSDVTTHSKLRLTLEPNDQSDGPAGQAALPAHRDALGFGTNCSAVRGHSNVSGAWVPLTPRASWETFGEEEPIFPGLDSALQHNGVSIPSHLPSSPHGNSPKG